MLSFNFVKSHINTTFYFYLQTFNETRLEVFQNSVNLAWQKALRTVQQLKEIANELSNPEILFEQLRVLLRDESKDFMKIIIFY